MKRLVFITILVFLCYYGTYASEAISFAAEDTDESTYDDESDEYEILYYIAYAVAFPFSVGNFAASYINNTKNPNQANSDQLTESAGVFAASSIIVVLTYSLIFTFGNMYGGDLHDRSLVIAAGMSVMSGIYCLTSIIAFALAGDAYNNRSRYGDYYQNYCYISAATSGITWGLSSIVAVTFWILSALFNPGRSEHRYNSSYTLGNYNVSVEPDGIGLKIKF